MKHSDSPCAFNAQKCPHEDANEAVRLFAHVLPLVVGMNVGVGLSPQVRVQGRTGVCSLRPALPGDPSGSTVGSHAYYVSEVLSSAVPAPSSYRAKRSHNSRDHGGVGASMSSVNGHNVARVGFPDGSLHFLGVGLFVVGVGDGAQPGNLVSD